MNIHKKSLQDEKRIKRWSICCWVSAGISWFIQQKYIQWIYQNLKYTKLGREFGIVFVFIVVFPRLLNLFLWPSQYYSEKELRENQISWKYEYCFPTISWIRETSRLDTWLYWQKFKEFYSLIKNYKNGYNNLCLDDLQWWNTPKIRIFEPVKKEFLWFIPTDINAWVLASKKYIKAQKYNLWKDFALLFSNRSNCWECILYSPEYYIWWHHNQWIYRKIIKKENFVENIFILTLFNSKIFQKIINNISTGSTFKELRIEQFVNISIPNFPEEKQQEIARQYYNKIEKNTDLTFENYLEKEKERNSKLWIFQLNMELFELRETLENLIDKIIMNEEINVDFWY